jgi:hypothetical protein
MTEDEKMEALLDEILSRQPKEKKNEQHTV